MRRTILILLLLPLFLQKLSAQKSNESEKDYKNTVRFNISNLFIFGGKSLVFGYERLLKNDKSFGVNFGQASFPSFRFINSDSLKINSTTSERGYNFSGDFRFYLSNQNKFAAPRGVYIGPYFSHNFFELKNTWQLNSTNGGNPQNIESTTNMTVSGIGIQLGYQFVFWNRMSLDMVLIGPGVAKYKLKTALGTNLGEEDKQKIFESINEALKDKFPGYNIVIDEGEFETSGTTSTVRLGYRYMVLLGYRF